VRADLSPLTDMRAFILTVSPNDSERRRNAEREIVKLGMPSQFVQGYTRSDLAGRALYSPTKNFFLSKRPLTETEIAIYAGHRKIWGEIAEGEDDVALVMEDDAQIVDSAAILAAMADSASHREAWDIVKFFDFHPKPVARSVQWGSTRLVVHRTVASGAVCYMIKRAAAAALLARTKIFRAIDEDLSHPWEFGLSIWSVEPNPVAEVSDTLGGSIRLQTPHARETHWARSAYAEILQGYKKVRTLLYLRRWR
jgi:GR25 family glycosyltransferase involved in LPS biosynthesis